MNEQKRVVFTKEELSAKVKVPAIVEQDLKRIMTGWNSAAYITESFPESRQLPPWLINLN